MRWICLLFGLIICTFQPAHAGSSPPKVLFRVHVQTTAEGLSAQESTSVRLPPDGEEIQVRTLPEVSEINIVSVQQDAGGLHVQFDHIGSVNLNAVTAQNQGRILVVLIDNTVFYAPVIDTQINNGQLDIPHQVPPAILQFLQQTAAENVRKASKA